MNVPLMYRANAVLLVLAVLALVAPVSTEAATFTVDSTGDAIDISPGDGVCADSGGRCTLRAALMEANALSGPARIEVPAGDYIPTIASTGSSDGDASGDFNITDGVELIGAGADVTFMNGKKGPSRHRVLTISDLNGPVRAEGVTLRNGSDDPGGGIHLISGGTTTITRTHLLNNDSERGSGIWLQGNGDVSILRSTISGGLDLSAGGLGGAIATNGTMDITIINTTISGNRGVGGVAMSLGGSPSVSLVNSTVAFNVARAGGTLQSQIRLAGSADIGLLNNMMVAPSGVVCTGGGPSGIGSGGMDLGEPVEVVCVPPSGGTFAVGDTEVTCTATDGSGNSTTTSATMTVLPIPLIITAEPVTKTYDGTPVSGFTVFYSGFLGGDDESVLDGGLTFGGDSQTAVDVGTYAVVPRGLTSSVYGITYVDGTSEITPAQLTAVANDKGASRRTTSRPATTRPRPRQAGWGRTRSR